MQAIKKYFQEVVQELKKVSWPSRQQTINMTMVVIVVSLIIAAYLAGLDIVFQKMMGAVLG
ncbi:MAG: preprotein translocase subunit SecE [Patescibacteria group bacterium]